jgi:hypothetical protein
MEKNEKKKTLQIANLRLAAFTSPAGVNQHTHGETLLLLCPGLTATHLLCHPHFTNEVETFCSSQAT